MRQWCLGSGLLPDCKVTATHPKGRRGGIGKVKLSLNCRSWRLAVSLQREAHGVALCPVGEEVPYQHHQSPLWFPQHALANSLFKSALCPEHHTLLSLTSGFAHLCHHCCLPFLQGLNPPVELPASGLCLLDAGSQGLFQGLAFSSVLLLVCKCLSITLNQTSCIPIQGL